MTTISLQKYHEQINYLLEDSQYSLAANHCRYILQQHPRHVNTYRLLARTMIEQGDYSSATELFQRVLSADPNDYIAHAGLSVVYREEDVLSQAIWHLERAYEIEPYNGAIQQELKGLYIEYSEQKAGKQREDSERVIPESLPLTKGALARLYIQSEFYAQAIDILRKALVEDEDRIDLEALLVEALWRDNQRKAAVQVCLQVLEKLPNCITANAVLAEIWLQIGRIDEAQDYLKDLQELTLMDVSNQDLESPAGSAFQPKGAFLLPVLFEVERMGDDLTSLTDGLPLETVAEDSTAAAEGSDDYQWLEGLGEEFVVGEVEPSLEDPVSTVTDSDWLRRELEASEEETAVSDDISSWIDEATATDSDEEESAIDPIGVVAAGAVAASVIGSQLKDNEDDTNDDDDPFAWLDEEGSEKDIPDEDETIFAQIEHAEEAEDMPDWLADMSGEDLEPVQADPAEIAIYVEPDEPDQLPETEDMDDGIYDWLDVVSDEPIEELEPGELDLSQFAEFDEEMDSEAEDDGEVVWRLTDELNPPEESENDEDLEAFDFEVSSDETGDLDGVPDWLLDSGGTDQLEDTTPAEDVDPDWLLDSSGTDQLAFASLDEDAAEEIGDELISLEESGINEEIGEFDLDVSPDETGDLEDVPDWLLGSSGTGELDAASITEEAGSEIADELAEWVAANQPEIEGAEDLPDWLPDEPEMSDAPALTQEISDQEEDGFFTNDLPDWLTDSSSDIDDSSPLDSAPLTLDESAAEESSPLIEEDLPDWLIGGAMDLDDSTFLETGELSEESPATEKSDTAGALPDWLVGDTSGFSGEDVAQSEVVSDETLPDWLSDDEDIEDLHAEDEEDSLSGTAVAGGLLGAAAAGAFAKALLDDDEENEDQPEQLMIDSSLEDEVMEDAVSDKQDDLIGPQDEPEKSEPLPQEDSDEFDWLDDLDDTSLSADTDSLPMDNLGDDLDWMDMDDSSDSGELNLDALLGIESEEEEPLEDSASEDEADPVLSGLAEDESLDWLDALADDGPEAVDEMPTWQWTEDSEEDPALALDELEESADPIEAVEPLAEDVDTVFSDEPGEADVVEDLDDAMSWLEDLAAEPDAPVEELPSVAEDMDLDAFFATDADVDMLNSESSQSETLGEIFAADTQNDSWLDGLADEEPIPDFLEEESEIDLDGFLGEDVEAETAVSAESEDTPEAVDDMGEPPEDLDDAMAWLEQLAARQGAPLDELPSVDDEPEDDGMGVAKVVAGAAALGAVGAALADDEEEDEPVDEADDLFETEVASEFVEETIAEDDLMAMDVPEDPDEAMAWLEKLAARQGAPLDELPSVSEGDEIPATPKAEVEDDLFGLEADEATFDDLMSDADALPELVEADDVLGEDDAMAWLDGLEDESSQTEAITEETAEEFGDYADIDFDDREFAEESAVSLDSSLSDELDWLESVTTLDSEEAAYNADDISVSDDELSDALEKLALLSAAGAAVGSAISDDDQPEIEEPVMETAVVDTETASDISAEDFVEEMPEDPDEAMAWLEKLAARQGAPLDELPSVEEDEYDDLAAEGAAALLIEEEAETTLEEVDFVAETDLEESFVAEETTPSVSPEDMDMDDAMAWLEQLAARQGTSLDELPTVDESDLEGEVAAPEWVADAQEEIVEELPVVTEEPIVEEVKEVAIETPVEDEYTTPPEDMDMDDAMAWLEQLAARQGAELDELPTVDNVPQAESDIDTPDWIANQTGPLDAEVLDSLNFPEAGDEIFEATPDEDFFAALDEVPAIEGIETDVKDSEIEDIDDSMPDWLSGGEDSEEDNPLGHTGWLNTLDEPDMGGWLAAEAEASTSSDVLDDVIPEAVDTDSLISTGGLEETGGLQDTGSIGDTGELRLPDDIPHGTMFTTELDEAQVLADLDLDDFGTGLDQVQLEAARSSLAGGDIDSALYDYQKLVETGESMHTVISDLERASELHQDKPMVRRMLGDAYMRNGQINKAIETYRDALDQM